MPTPDVQYTFHSGRTGECTKKKTKLGKAAGFDGIYPQFLKYTGLVTRKWLSQFYTDILTTSIFKSRLKKLKLLPFLCPVKT